MTVCFHLQEPIVSDASDSLLAHAAFGLLVLYTPNLLMSIVDFMILISNLWCLVSRGVPGQIAAWLCGLRPCQTIGIRPHRKGFALSMQQLSDPLCRSYPIRSSLVNVEDQRSGASPSCVWKVRKLQIGVLALTPAAPSPPNSTTCVMSCTASIRGSCMHRQAGRCSQVENLN